MEETPKIEEQSKEPKIFNTIQRVKKGVNFVTAKEEVSFEAGEDSGFDKNKERSLIVNISPYQKIKIHVLKRLGFKNDEIVSRFEGMRVEDVKNVLKTYKPSPGAIKKLSESIIESMSQDMAVGFKVEMNAIDDVIYWGLNRLRMKVGFDTNLSVKDLISVVELAWKMREGNPFDEQVNQFFMAISNKQEIINMAKGEVKDDGHPKPGQGAETSSGQEIHRE